MCSVHILSYCKHSHYCIANHIFTYASTVREAPGYNEFCDDHIDHTRLVNNDCSIEETEPEANLNISIVPHSNQDANITVSWAHLNLTSKYMNYKLIAK